MLHKKVACRYCAIRRQFSILGLGIEELLIKGSRQDNGICYYVKHITYYVMCGNTRFLLDRHCPCFPGARNCLDLNKTHETVKALPGTRITLVKQAQNCPKVRSIHYEVKCKKTRTLCKLVLKRRLKLAAWLSCYDVGLWLADFP